MREEKKKEGGEGEGEGEGEGRRRGEMSSMCCKCWRGSG